MHTVVTYTHAAVLKSEGGVRLERPQPLSSMRGGITTAARVGVWCVLGAGGCTGVVIECTSR